MAHLFRELSLGHSKRDTTLATTSRSSSMASTIPSDLPPSPLGQLAVHAPLRFRYLRLIAYETVLSRPEGTTSSCRAFDQPSCLSPLDPTGLLSPSPATGLMALHLISGSTSFFWKCALMILTTQRPWFDNLMEHVKKTWLILGINQTLHNLCFTWLLFSRYVVTGKVEMDLLYACESQLAEVAKDAKTAKDPEYSQVLSATLSAVLGWAEKRLLAYHDTFDRSNVGNMERIVSLGVSAARILVEDISNEYRRRRKGEVDVARTRIETYIRSSLRTIIEYNLYSLLYIENSSILVTLDFHLLEFSIITWFKFIFHQNIFTDL